MKKILIKIIIGIVLIGGGFFSIYSNAEAQTYNIHEKIPGQEGKAGLINGVNYGKKGVDTLQDYLESIYKFGIAIVAILAVVMVGIGGFMYIVTSVGNAGKIADAKDIITSALTGLVMALLAWLILFVINPDLVGTKLKPIKIEQNNNWVNDGEPDKMCKNVKDDQFNEVTNCKSDKICAGKQCVYKNSFCTITGQKIEGICDTSDFGQKEGDSCGLITTKGNNLLGVCKEDSCGQGKEVTSGKKCVNDLICCTEYN